MTEGNNSLTGTKSLPMFSHVLGIPSVGRINSQVVRIGVQPFGCSLLGYSTKNLYADISQGPPDCGTTRMDIECSRSFQERYMAGAQMGGNGCANRRMFYSVSGFQYGAPGSPALGGFLKVPPGITHPSNPPGTGR